MPRKTITATATRLRLVPPPTSQGKSTVNHLLPAGARASDKFISCRIHSDDLFNAGIITGDNVLCYITRDVQRADLAVVRCSDESYVVGRYYPAPGGYFRIEMMVDGKPAAIYRPGDGEVIGRAVQVQRHQRIIPTRIYLRPIR